MGSLPFFFFIVYLLAWRKNLGDIHGYGLYSLVDGQLAAWYSKALVEWSHPLNLHGLNPFEGMGSLFLPNNPWWNPGALALSLPFNSLVNYNISYSIYWIEAYVSLWVLARAFGFSRIWAILTAQVYILVFFPPTSHFFTGLSFNSLAPFNAHLMALANLALVCFMHLGQRKFIGNLTLFLILLGLCFILLMSGPITILTYAPIYFVMSLAFFSTPIKASASVWKLSFIALLMVLAWKNHIIEYYINVAQYVSRSLGVESLQFFIPKSWKFVSPCINPQMTLLCLNYPIAYFHLFSLFGAIIACFWRQQKFRRMAFAFIPLAIAPDLILALMMGDVLKLGQINIAFFLWATYPFQSMFFVIFAAFCFEKLEPLIISLLTTIRNQWPHIRQTVWEYFCKLPRLNVHLIFLLVLIPSCAFLYNKTLRRVNPKFPEETPIVAYLQKHISLKPNTPYRGSVASYFASHGSPLRLHSEVKRLSFEPDDYIDAREYLSLHHGNRHMFSDLWRFNIPTLEEYDQMISKLVYLFFQHVLADPNDKGYKTFLNVYRPDFKLLGALGVRFVITDLELSDPDLSFVMKQNCLGTKDGLCLQNSLIARKVAIQLLATTTRNQNNLVKLPINDLTTEFETLLTQNMALDKSQQRHREFQKILTGFSQAAQMASQGREFLQSQELANVEKYFLGYVKAFTTIPLYLYEIKHPNSSGYSPAKVITIQKKEDLIAQLRNKNFIPTQTVILQEPLSGITLSPATYSELQFIQNGMHIKANSTGTSLLLLPLQYSHCLKMSQTDPAQKVRLIRANMIQTALLFEKSIDIELKHDFRVGESSQCMKEDVQDIKTLGLI